MESSSLHGFLVVDKPGGVTSRDAVDRAQSWFPRGTRLGHTGTLDPLATGVLVLAVGSGTRLTEFVQDMDKTYRAGIRLGARSDTEDVDGTITPMDGATAPDREVLDELLQSFVGAIDQVPPAYSAAKISGRRAYDLARRGHEVTLAPRRVRVYQIDVISYVYPKLDLEVRCGKGTYIRSLARDLGERLGCGGLIDSLRRTRVGPFEASAGIGLDALASEAQRRLLPLIAAVAELPNIAVTAAETQRLRHGQCLCPGASASDKSAEAVAMVQGKETLVGIGAWDAEKRILTPVKVMPVIG
ncbi:MAG: tRNA pseudouridine(55) synthase TruB [Gemmataceae bacterium]|nr:tRNA pseudouridine(55) synthase TruB [Gemmataceae bacterium]